MVKWLLMVVVVMVIFSVISQRLRFRIPGDFIIPVRGRIYYIPLASTVVLSLLVWALGKVL